MKILYVVIPCYNEEEVLPVTSSLFLEKLEEMINTNLISDESRILFVDDGSKDNTWNIITELSEKDKHFIGRKLSRNRGHQNALLAGLMEAKDKCDMTISIDSDGQDDINAMNKMVAEFYNGCEVVYGVRSSRKKDSFFKRFTAESFYKFLNFMGADVIYNHADYRLISSKVLNEFANFKEVNLFLRGMVPLVGFKSTSVYYERNERLAGKSHYPFKKMMALALDRNNKLKCKTSSYDYWAWAFCICIKLFRCDLGCCDSNTWSYCCRLGKSYSYNLFYGWNTVNLSWNYWRIYRESIFRGKSKTSLYN